MQGVGCQGPCGSILGDAGIVHAEHQTIREPAVLAEGQVEVVLPRRSERVGVLALHPSGTAVQEHRRSWLEGGFLHLESGGGILELSDCRGQGARLQ